MIKLRLSQERGYENRDWLESYHTFSFNTYYDPNFINYRSLRVINEDRVKGGKGFGEHSHKNMEIITYVIEGALEHRDSLGNRHVIRQGEIQLMSAGTGIIHSEYNFFQHDAVHFLQIWILPNKSDLSPKYAQKQFSTASKWETWCLLVSENGRDGSLTIQQDADLYSSLLEKGGEIKFQTVDERFYWIQILSGKFQILDTVLNQGDAGAIQQESLFTIQCLEEGEIFLFDLA
jgi:redox-sensitive bicupin YhaK (pirin superfamily)